MRYPNGSSLVLLFLPALLLTGCATHTPQMKNVTPLMTISAPTETTKTPKLILTAMQQTGFAPLRVTLHAVLQNVSPHDGSWNCVEQAWAFGDGSISAYRPDCADTSEVETEFFEDHVFSNSGNFVIRFGLGNYRSNPVSIRV